MIRFQPDTLREAVMRPFAMAAPDGGVYVEIIAPDFRFAFAVVLFVLGLLFARRLRGGPAVLALLGLTALAFVPWLVTTGNGRYFMPFLLLAGPLCVGLAHALPGTRALRATVAGFMLACQGFLVWTISPFHSWGHLLWREPPAFGLSVPEAIRAQPATYVSLSTLSYSLIAPAFHPDSRWINIASLEAAPAADKERAHRLLFAPGPIFAVFPTVRGGDDHGRMYPFLAHAIDELLGAAGLSLADPGACQIIPSSGLRGTDDRRLRKTDGADTQPQYDGFWRCPIRREPPPPDPSQVPLAPHVDAVFDKLEHMCPRIFPPHEASDLRIPGGAVRGYAGSDFKLYVYNDGDVWYKYFRALNGVGLGQAKDILAPGFQLDCEHIHGRSGLPWERGI